MIKKKGRKREAGEWHQRETGLSASPDIALCCAPVLLSMTIKKGKNMGTRRRRSKYKKMEPSPRRIREKRPKIFYVYCGSRDVTGFFSFLFFIFISVRCIYCVDNNPISFDIIPCEQEEREKGARPVTRTRLNFRVDPTSFEIRERILMIFLDFLDIVP